MMKVLAIACITVPVIVAPAIAQQPAFKRTVLRSMEYPAGHTTVTVIVEIAPGACTGRPAHPGIDSGYVCGATSSSKSMGSPNRPLRRATHTRRRPRYRTTLARSRATS